jgi:hypothetical protein
MATENKKELMNRFVKLINTSDEQLAVFRNWSVNAFILFTFHSLHFIPWSLILVP